MAKESKATAPAPDATPEFTPPGTPADTRFRAKPGYVPVGNQQLVAGPCELTPGHLATRVYRTVGRTRHCVCDDCGHTWKQTGDFADPLRQYAHELAETFAAAVQTPVDAPDGSGQVVLLSLADARELTKKLRELIAA